MPIHDQSYRRYTGEKRPVQSAWTVIARAGLMSFLSRKAFLGLLLVAWIPFIVARGSAVRGGELLAGRDVPGADGADVP